MGPILTFLLVFFPYLAIRYWQFFWAHEQGTSLVSKLGSGAIQRFTELETLVGVIVVGGFAPSIVRLTSPLKWQREVEVRGETVTQTIGLQDQLDKVLPYLLPVGLTLLVYWLLKKKDWTPMRAIVLIILAGFLGGALGIFGQSDNGIRVSTWGEVAGGICLRSPRPSCLATARNERSVHVLGVPGQRR